MKRILITILVLIPMLSWAYGTKPVNSITVSLNPADTISVRNTDTLNVSVVNLPDTTIVSGTLTVNTEDSVTISNDTLTVKAPLGVRVTQTTGDTLLANIPLGVTVNSLPNIRVDSIGTVSVDGRVRVDSIGTVTITGAVTTSGSATVSGSVDVGNFADQEPVYRDSSLTASIYELDTLTVTMSSTFAHTKGFYRATWIADSSCDSVKVQYRFVHGTFGLTRWLPLFVDTVSVAGNASAYVSSNGIVTYIADNPNWALLYDPTSTSPITCVPKTGDQLELRFIQLGNTAQEVRMTVLFTWQEN